MALLAQPLRRTTRSSPWLGALALTALATLPPAAQAGPVLFAPFDGSGNALVFDATTGDGGWSGAINQSPVPAVADPLSLVSVVLFNYDAAAKMLSGQFEFTRSTDLGATLYGLVTGTTTEADVFATGGQFSLDYTVLGGTGDFANTTGYGLSFLNFDPAALPDNYTESGLLVLAVPEPGALPLVAGALLAMWGLGRVRRHRVLVPSRSAD